jgi:hypothetical protein
MQDEKTKGSFQVHPTYLYSTWNPLTPWPGGD